MSTEELKIQPSLTVVNTNVFNPCATPGSLKTCFRLPSKTKIFLYFPVTTMRKKLCNFTIWFSKFFQFHLKQFFSTIFTLKVTVSILIWWIQRGHLLEIWNLILLDFQSSPLLSPSPFAFWPDHLELISLHRLNTEKWLQIIQNGKKFTKLPWQWYLRFEIFNNKIQLQTILQTAGFLLYLVRDSWLTFEKYFI